MYSPSLTLRENSKLKIYALIFIITSLCFINGLWGDFLFDDMVLIYQNPWVKEVTSSKGVATFSKKSLFLAPKGNSLNSHHRQTNGLIQFQKQKFNPYYRPIRNLSYAFDAYLSKTFSQKLHPFYFHFTNLLLHIGNVFLVFWILLYLAGNPKGALLGALFFAIHPVQTESVTYISGRRDLLTAFFLLTALFLYLKKEHQGKTSKIEDIKIYFLFLLAIFTKEIALVFPLLLMVYHLHKGEKPTSLFLHTGLWITTLGMVGYILFWKNPIAIGLAKTGYWGGSLSNAILSFSRAFWKYIGLVLFPLYLTVDYSFYAFLPSTGLLHPWQTLPSIVFFFVFLIGLVYFYKKKFACPWIWFLLFLLPVSQIIPHPERFAEHYLYLPLIGIALLISRGDFQKNSWIFCLSLILTLLGMRTILRNQDWRNEYQLWSSAVKTYPNCARARMALGKALLDKGDSMTQDYGNHKNPYWQKALQEFQKALQLSQNYSTNRGKAIYLNSLFWKGLCLLKLQEWKKGRDLFLALEKEKGGGKIPFAQSKAHYHIQLNLGAAYLNLGNLKKAKEKYKKVLQWYPKEERALFGLIQVYMQEKNFRKAETLLRKGLSQFLTPSMEERFRLQLAHIYLKEKKSLEAIQILEPLIKTSKNPWVYYLLGEGWLLKNLRKGIFYYQKALSLSPQPELAILLGQRFYELGKPRMALAILEEVLEKNPTPLILKTVVKQLVKWKFPKKAQEIWKAYAPNLSLDQKGFWEKEKKEYSPNPNLAK